MQTLTISGYLSRDAEQSQTRDGTAVTRWNVPVRQFSNGNEGTIWYRVNIWGKRADFAAKGRKGDFVAVSGDFTVGEYEGKPQYELRASDFSLISSQPRDNQRQEPRGNGGGGNQSRGGFAKDLDDDIPF